MKKSKLFDNEELLTQALNSIGYRGSWHLDHRSELIRFSPEAELLLPLTRHELLKPVTTSRFDAFLHDDDRAWLQGRRAKPDGGGGVIRTVIEYRVVGIDGIRWIQSQSLRRIRDDGTPIDGRGMNFDITALKAAGDGVSRNPLAPLSHPINHLAEGVMLALVAAEQARLPGLVEKLRGIARTTARLLAKETIFPSGRSLH